MAWIFEDGKRARAYGVRLPANWNNEVPKQMLLLDVPEAENIVFEHGKFDYEQEKETVAEKLKSVIDGFDYGCTEYVPDNSPGRLSYGIFDPEKFEKEIKPVKHKYQIASPYLKSTILSASIPNGSGVTANGRLDEVFVKGRAMRVLCFSCVLSAQTERSEGHLILEAVLCADTPRSNTSFLRPSEKEIE